MVTAGAHVAGAGVIVTVLVTAGGQTAAEVVVGTAGAGVVVGAAVVGCGCHGVTTG